MKMTDQSTTTSDPAPAAAVVAAPVAAPAPVASVIAEAIAPPAPEPAPAPKSPNETLYPEPKTDAAAAATAPVLDADGKPIVAAVEPKLDADGKPIVEAAPAPGAPEKYEAFTLPENATLDEATTGALTELARTNNLTQAAAQSLVDLHFASLKANMESWVAGQTATFDQARADLRAQQAALPELQGEQRKQSLETIGRLLDEFDPLPADAKPGEKGQVRQLIEHNLIGDHPAFIKFMLTIADTLVGEGTTTPNGSAGKLAGPNNGRAVPKSAGDILYPNS